MVKRGSPGKGDFRPTTRSGRNGSGRLGAASPAGGRAREMAGQWYDDGVITTIDKAGRIVVPVEMRRRLGLEPGTELEIVVEDSSLRIVRNVPGPEIRRRKGRRLASPRLAREERREIDVADLIEEERTRWPG